MIHRNWIIAALGVAAVSACSKSAPESSPAPAAKAPAEAPAYNAPAPAAAPAVAPPTAAATSAQAGMEPPGNVTDILSSKLGLTPEQASGGVGAILAYAQGKLPAADYEKVSAAIPGAADNVKAAQDAGVTEPISDPAGLSAAFTKLGIPPEAAQQLVPTVTEYVSKVGGPEVGQLLAGIF